MRCEHLEQLHRVAGLHDRDTEDRASRGPYGLRVLRVDRVATGDDGVDAGCLGAADDRPEVAGICDSDGDNCGAGSRDGCEGLRDAASDAEQRLGRARRADLLENAFREPRDRRPGRADPLHEWSERDVSERSKVQSIEHNTALQCTLDDPRAFKDESLFGVASLPVS